MPPSITCPICGMTSHNPNDVVNGYCGNCHAYHPATYRHIERRLLGTTCPTCGKDNDDGTAVNGPNAMPSPGDLGVCAYCGSLNTYTEDLKLRPATESERGEIERHPALKRAIQMAKDVAKEFRRKRAQKNASSN